MRVRKFKKIMPRSLSLFVMAANVAILAIALQARVSEYTAQQYYLRAVERIRSSDFPGAMKLLRGSIDLAPGNAYYHAAYALAAEN